MLQKYDANGEWIVLGEKAVIAQFLTSAGRVLKSDVMNQARSIVRFGDKLDKQNSNNIPIIVSFWHARSGCAERKMFPPRL